MIEDGGNRTTRNSLKISHKREGYGITGGRWDSQGS